MLTVDLPSRLPLREQGDHWLCDVDGVEVKLTNLAKVFWPKEKLTKGDLVNYYYNVAEWILPHVMDRPLTLKRMPNGVGKPHFYQRNAPDKVPDWLETCEVEPDEGDVDNMIVPTKTADLLYVANLGCIEFHPLHSRCGRYGEPDYIVFDLDPFEPAGFDEALTVARHVKVAADVLDLDVYPKTSGATGVQVYAPVERGLTFEQTRAVAETLGRFVQDADRSLVTMEWEVSKRDGKVFFDHNMNRKAASLASAYSLRPEPGATVSTPLTWDEVEDGVNPADFTITTIFERLENTKDPFLPVQTAPTNIATAMRKLGIAGRRRKSA